MSEGIQDMWECSGVQGFTTTHTSQQVEFFHSLIIAKCSENPNDIEKKKDSSMKIPFYFHSNFRSTKMAL